MVIDSSAIVALLLREPTGPAIAEALRVDEVVLLLGAPTRTEMTVVMQRSGMPGGVGALRGLLDDLGVIDVPFDRILADAAADAYATYGKGNHAARLNLGDCFTYAVAKRTGEPVLCVGDDVAHTDIAVVPLGD